MKTTKLSVLFITEIKREENNYRLKGFVLLNQISHFIKEPFEITQEVILETLKVFIDTQIYTSIAVYYKSNTSFYNYAEVFADGEYWTIKSSLKAFNPEIIKRVGKEHVEHYQFYL